MIVRAQNGGGEALPTGADRTPSPSLSNAERGGRQARLLRLLGVLDPTPSQIIAVDGEVGTARWPSPRPVPGGRAKSTAINCAVESREKSSPQPALSSEWTVPYWFEG